MKRKRQRKPELRLSPKEIVGKIFSGILKKPDTKKIFVKTPVNDEVAGNRRVTMLVGAILIVLLVVSIGFGIVQKNRQNRRAVYEPRLTQAKHEFEEAVSLLSLNAERSRELVASARGIVDGLVAEGIDDPELVELKSSIDQNVGQILGEYSSSPELFLDLSLLSEGFGLSDISVTPARIFVLDRDGRKIVRIDINTKRTEVVVGPEQLNEVWDLAGYLDKVYVINASGLFEVGDDKTPVFENEWSDNTIFSVYAGNIYTLDRGTSELSRYTASGAPPAGGFSSRQNWLAPGAQPDLSNVFSWAIDGSIWMLSSSGSIFRYTRGNQQGLDISGVFPELILPNAIYTNEELEYVYILESSSKRIVVIDKEGNYKAQYFDDAIADAKNLAVSEVEGKIILALEDKLLMLDIKHL